MVVVSGSTRAVSVSADGTDGDCAIAALNREMRVINPSITPGAMNWGPVPPERRPITSSMDQPSSTASLRAATAAWNGLGAVDHACGIPAALDARRAPASASARGEPACVLKPVGDASSIRAIADLNRCNAARARSAPGPSMPASVVVAAMKEAACRQRCGAKSITDGCGSEAGGGPVRVVIALRSAQGSSPRGVEAAAVCAVAGEAVAG